MSRDVMWTALCQALDLPSEGPLCWQGEGALPSVYAVSELAAASVGVAGWTLAQLLQRQTGTLPALSIDQPLASRWFQASLQPQGWTLPPAWDPLAGDYPTRDGWIRLHTNAPQHRAAALQALGLAGAQALDKAGLATAVGDWSAADLEAAVVQAGGCAAEMRGEADWAQHPQGRAVGAEPLLRWTTTALRATPASAWSPQPGRPLAGLRVLDLTRVLAGPVATRFLAGYGADVLRLDPPDWDEPSLAPEVTLGKRCARLDLRHPAGAARFSELLAQADVLVHGYRADALGRLGFGPAQRRTLKPALVDVSLNAYGWTGPWRDRRGFDSLVQMSAGMAEAGMRLAGADPALRLAGADPSLRLAGADPSLRLAGAGVPRPLPVQALDHATGYLLAAAVLRGLLYRVDGGVGSQAQTSLAAMAALLGRAGPASVRASSPLPPLSDADWQAEPELTAWGPARRLRPALQLSGVPARWARPAGPLGSWGNWQAPHAASRHRSLPSLRHETLQPPTPPSGRQPPDDTPVAWLG